MDTTPYIVCKSQFSGDKISVTIYHERDQSEGFPTSLSLS